MTDIFDNPAAFKPFFGDATAAAYTGKRREDGQTRPVSVPLDAYVQRGSRQGGARDSVAMGRGCTWDVSFPLDKWPEVSEPQIGDAVEFADPQNGWKTVRLKVASVSQDCGWWTLKARPEGGA